jgi:hypothetical protein
LSPIAVPAGPIRAFPRSRRNLWFYDRGVHFMMVGCCKAPRPYPRCSALRCQECREVRLRIPRRRQLSCIRLGRGLESLPPMCTPSGCACTQSAARASSQKKVRVSSFPGTAEDFFSREMSHLSTWIVKGGRCPRPGPEARGRSRAARRLAPCSMSTSSEWILGSSEGSVAPRADDSAGVDS